MFALMFYVFSVHINNHVTIKVSGNSVVTHADQVGLLCFLVCVVVGGELVMLPGCS